MYNNQILPKNLEICLFFVCQFYPLRKKMFFDLFLVFMKIFLNRINLQKYPQEIYATEYKERKINGFLLSLLMLHLGKFPLYHPNKALS